MQLVERGQLSDKIALEKADTFRQCYFVDSSELFLDCKERIVQQLPK